MSEKAQLVSKRNVKYLYELLKNGYEPDMSMELFVEMLKSDKRLHKTFFNSRTLEAQKPKQIHPCLMFDTDEEEFIPKYPKSQQVPFGKVSDRK